MVSWAIFLNESLREIESSFPYLHSTLTVWIRLELAVKELGFVVHVRHDGNPRLRQSLVGHCRSGRGGDEGDAIGNVESTFPTL